MGAGEGKKGEIVGCSAEEGPAEVPRRLVSRSDGALKGGGPEGWRPPKGGVPKISRFFHPHPPLFSFFLLLLGVVSWNFGGVIEGQAHMCTFGDLGLS